MPEHKLPAVLRQEQILQELDKKKFGTTLGFAKWLSVSEMTVRRDFDYLSNKGLLTRTHGGAVSLGHESATVIDLIEPEVSKRELHATDAKSAIADTAFAMIASKQSVALDIGSTALALAGLLHKTDIRLFSSSLKIATELKNTSPQVYVPGGLVNGSEPSVVGPQAVSYFHKYYFDIAFICVSGLSVEGFFDYSLEDTEVKRAFIGRSKTSVVLLDSSKFDHMSVALVANFSEIDVLITDKPPPPSLSDALGVAGVRIKIAGKTGKTVEDNKG